MQARKLPDKTSRTLAGVLALALILAGAALALAALQAQKAPPAEKKDSRAVLFTGFKKAEVAKTEQKGTTVTAGAKGLGGPQEAETIAKSTAPSSARDLVNRMASAKPSPQEMQAFLAEGKLATERKGGSQ